MAALLTVEMKGDDYLVKAPGRTIMLTEDDAIRLRNYLCAYLGMPTDEEIKLIG